MISTRGSALLRSRAHGHGLENFAAFFNDVEMICREIVEDILCSRGPRDFDGLGFDCLVEAEVDAEIALRVIAAAAAYLF